VFRLSQKYIDFIKDMDVDADFLEGTTASGKTTIGAGVKFMIKVSASSKKLHIIAGRTTGVVEKNILQQDNGILDLHKNATYYGNGDKDYKFPHIKFEDKIILVMGYDTRDKWENALGGQYGCVLIDEINTADIEFVREISTRNDYMIATLNPDSPDIPVYKEFINRARPHPQYEKDVPASIMQELKEPEYPKWRYWFFTFLDNAGLTPEQIEKKKQSAPVGTKMYKNKILGLRGRATGLVLPLKKENIITEEEAKKLKYIYYSVGCDTSYSKKSHDKLSFSFIGITNDRKCVVLQTESRNNKDAVITFAPSDVIPMLLDFAERCKTKWGFSKNVYIDSADAGTISEAQKYKRNTACIYDFTGAWKKTKIITRVQLQQSWMQTGDFIVVDTCTDYIDECNTYSYTEDGQPEDAHDHCINACQYAWLPYKAKIGDMEAIKQIIKDAYD
jgi:PBSX family phage terminase large subunit